MRCIIIILAFLLVSCETPRVVDPELMRKSDVWLNANADDLVALQSMGIETCERVGKKFSNISVVVTNDRAYVKTSCDL